MEPTLGQIIMFGGNFAPRGWALCDGTLLPINQNQALFSILGTTYGGDGRTTFALPDLRGRMAIHAGSGAGLTPRNLGAKGGTQENTLTIQNMPSHNHTASGSINLGTAANQPAGTNNFLPVTTGSNFYSNTAGNTNLNSESVNINVTNNGGSQPYNNMQPYTVVNYLIAIQGLFPSRN